MRVVVLLEGTIVGFKNFYSWIQSRLLDNAGGWVLSSSEGLETVTVYRPHWGANDLAEPASPEALLRSGVFPKQLLDHDVDWVLFEAQVKLDASPNQESLPAENLLEDTDGLPRPP